MKIKLATLLMALALVIAPAVSAELPYHGKGHLFVNADELVWTDIGSMAPGAKISVIEGNLAEAAPFTFRLKLPANYRIAPHVHPAYERVTVLEGTLYFAHGKEFSRDAARAMAAGSFAVMAPGEPMFAYTEEPTVIQLHGTGPWGIEYLDPADDPRN